MNDAEFEPVAERREPEKRPPHSQRRTPVFNQMPAVILMLAALMLGVQLAQVLPVPRNELIHGLVFWLGTVRTGEVAQMIPPAPLVGISPYILHVFVHFGWTHLLFNLGALLAFGTIARIPFGGGLKAELGFLAFFFACALGGVGLHLFFHGDETSTMAGASTAISGLVAAAGWAHGGRALMLRLALPWLGLNLLIALADPIFAIPIAWAGHIGGLLVGMLAYPGFLRVFRS